MSGAADLPQLGVFIACCPRRVRVQNRTFGSGGSLSQRWLNLVRLLFDLSGGSTPLHLISSSQQQDSNLLKVEFIKVS